MEKKGEEVDKTRQGISTMEIEDQERQEAARKKASAGGIMGMVARGSWTRLDGLMRGRKMLITRQEGEEVIKVVSPDEELGSDEHEVRMEMIVDEEEQLEIIEVRGEVEEDRRSNAGGVEKRYGFLNMIAGERREKELDGKLSEGRKRGREVEEETIGLRSLVGGEAWDRREKMMREDKRWKLSLIHI